MRLRTFPSALASVVLLAAACGDDDSTANANQSGDAGPDSSVPSTTKGGAGASGSSGDDKPTSSDKPAAGQGDEGESGGKAGEGGSGGSGRGAGGRGAGGRGASGRGGSGAGRPTGGGPATAGRSGGAGRGSPAGVGGSASAGTGGKTTAGTGGTTPADAGVGDDDAGTLPVGGPYFTSGNLRGYVWLAQTGAGTSLRVTGYDTAEFTAPVCIRGSVAATPDYSGNAMLGFNLNQPADGELATFTPTLAGLQLNVTNLGASPLRIQIQAQDGATNDQGRWCAVVNGSGGFIPWTDFNTACWDGSGAAYARQPIVSAILLIPGTTDVAIPYDVCLNELAQTDASGDDADAGI